MLVRKCPVCGEPYTIDDQGRPTHPFTNRSYEDEHIPEEDYLELLDNGDKNLRRSRTLG